MMAIYKPMSIYACEQIIHESHTVYRNNKHGFTSNSTFWRTSAARPIVHTSITIMNRIEQAIKNPQQVVWWPLIPVEMRRSLSSSRFLSLSSSAAYHAKIMLSEQINTYMWSWLTEEFPSRRRALCVCWPICVDTNMTMKEAGNPAKNAKIQEKIMKNFRVMPTCHSQVVMSTLIFVQNWDLARMRTMESAEGEKKEEKI